MDAIREIYTLARGTLARQIPRWTVPIWTLKWAAKVGDFTTWMRGTPLLLDSNGWERLTRSAAYSSGKIERELGFRPAFSLDAVLTEMMGHFHDRDP